MEKLKKAGIVLGLLSVIILGVYGGYYIGHSQGHSDASTILDGKKLDLKSINTEIASQNTTLENLNFTHNEKRDEFEALEKELSEAKNILEEKEKTNVDLEQAKTDLDKHNKDIEQLKSDIKEKEKRLQKLEEGIILKEKEPRTLSAGQFTVGKDKDIDAGRYRITTSTNGNYFVNKGSDVNIMLGKGSYYEPEYVLYLTEGDEIEQSMPVKYETIE